MQGEVALARRAESIGGRVKQRIKRLLGEERLTLLRLAPLHRAIGNHGWRVDDLRMTDRQAAEHYANERELDVVFRTIVRFFHEYKLCFIRETLGDEYIRRSRFLEVGDSDGLVLQALGKGELSINNDPRCVELIRRNGVQAHLGLGERLEVPDKSYDVVMAFETLEHSLNPVAFLEEMIRVAREKVIVSIPGVTRTIIHPRVRGERIGEEHVFEFHSADLLRLTTHLPLQPGAFRKMSVFAPSHRPLAWLFYRVSTSLNGELFGGSHRWFDFYVFDVVGGDQGVSARQSAALYARPWTSWLRIGRGSR